MRRGHSYLLVVCAGLLFSFGSVLSDTSAYAPTPSIDSVIWAIITVVNHVTVWALGAVLIGWYIKTSSYMRSSVLGGAFGFTAMTGYYLLSWIFNADLVLEWETALLIIISTFGGALSAVIGRAALREYPGLLLLSAVPLLLTLVARLYSGVREASISVVDGVQLVVLLCVFAFVCAVTVVAVRKKSVA